MILDKMKSIITDSPRIIRCLSANFADYGVSWEVGVENDPSAALIKVEGQKAEPVCRVAYIQMTGESQFDVVLHDKEGNWFLSSSNDVSGASSITIEYFRNEREYEDHLLEVFPHGHNLAQLGLEVDALSETSKTAKPQEHNSIKNAGKFAVIHTANDGRDYPLESFVSNPCTEEEAQKIAESMNRSFGYDQSPDFWKVVVLPYRLGRGMEDAV